MFFSYILVFFLSSPPQRKVLKKKIKRSQVPDVATGGRLEERRGKWGCGRYTLVKMALASFLLFLPLHPFPSQLQMAVLEQKDPRTFFFLLLVLPSFFFWEKKILSKRTEKKSYFLPFVAGFTYNYPRGEGGHINKEEASWKCNITHKERRNKARKGKYYKEK